MAQEWNNAKVPAAVDGLQQYKRRGMAGVGVRLAHHAKPLLVAQMPAATPLLWFLGDMFVGPNAMARAAARMRERDADAHGALSD